MVHQQQQPSFGRRGLTTAPIGGAGPSAFRGQGPFNEAASSARNPIWDEIPAGRGGAGSGAQENFGPAGFWIRVLSYVIDSLVLAALTLALGIVAREAIGLPLTGSYFPLSVIVGITYFALFHSGGWQATPGKRAVGVYVVRSDGGALSIPHALGRYIAVSVSVFTLGIGFLMAGWNRDKKALHDFVAGTRAVRGRID